MRVGGKGSYCLMGAEFDFGKRQSSGDGDYGCTNNKENVTGLYAYKRLKW